MKAIKYLTGSIIMAALLASCSDTPSYPSGSSVTAGQVSATIDGETVTVEAVDAELSSSFIRGFDASAVNDSGTGSYYDASGNEKDIFNILPSYGVNWVRLRIWNNPDSDNNPSVPGASDLEVVLDQALRAKAAGLRLLLDFHYSDYWADPGKQLIPEDWLDCTTSDELAAEVTDYTTEVLTALVSQGTAPDMIQIGNEISSGILLHSAMDEDENVTAASSDIKGTFCSDNYFKYLAAGIEAARTCCPDARIMLHFTDINRNNPVSYLSSFDTAFETYGVDYDVVGLSYYPKWSSHGTIDALGSKIASIQSTYGKDVVIVETNVDNTISSTSSENYYDSVTVANLTVDDEIYSGIDTDSTGVPASYQNQANIIRAVIEVAAQNGALGVFTWGGEYKGSWEYGLFASSGKPAPSLVVLNVQ
ncbi:glycosyl hydrolase 53 family protein [Treponema sp.]|uniref:glycosyl hydrolase 53 family protein n=1 Tax=Treponema sp. TaxID=166 RepID=UPI0025FD958E|nr:glycosyl hydrolase 53 family protein [Treponema sp.]MCR5219141.1 arabinogalactan endo-1,4-beta-galactosidase [Treponema sp.]